MILQRQSNRNTGIVPPKPGVQQADDPNRGQPRPGQVDSLERDHRQLRQQLEEAQRFDVHTWAGAFPRGGNLVLIDATAAPVNIPLPPAASQRDRTVVFKKVDASAHAVTLTANGTETIDGAATATIVGQWDVISLASNGEAWFVV